MRCENKTCRRELTAQEPVYRCFVILKEGPPHYDDQRATIHVCTTCAETRAQWDQRAKDRPPYPYRDRYTGNVHQPIKWREPRPCEHCGRTVIQERGAETRVIACSWGCRQLIYNTNRRQLELRFCHVCGARLSGNQRDYCSPAHKQAAYRARQR
jgi:hypothetical protein